MSKKHKKISAYLSYIEHFIILNTSGVTRCISISAFFFSLVGISIGITISTTGLTNYAITARVKKYKSLRK